ncbi:hypothetical protein QR680_007867 [Steinernema hermaphroditum]|uniref:Nucleotide-diphospho-sugar transferase domain-containing protein n=1 Tax=Steinernema hermaphroditum TaxID=289476 RepID=A0AA39IG34_9BILA|nr:hypothetical protein QR680_007867 [Steinernema hermaphroditum]
MGIKRYFHPILAALRLRSNCFVIYTIFFLIIAKWVILAAVQLITSALRSEMDPMVAMYRLERDQKYPIYLAWNNRSILFSFKQMNQSRLRPLDIGILMIVDEKTDLREYLFALDSISCYAHMHEYAFNVVRDTLAWRRICPQSNIMFRRHCMVAHMLNNHTWTLFLDADVGVINPNKLIEEWIDPSVDVIMYDRFYNWEVAAGSYLARNSTTAKTFLQSFANYEYRIPASFHGWDNGALHAFLLEWILPAHRHYSMPCFDVWTYSKSWDDLFTFEACIRAFLGKTPPCKNIKILSKGTGWMRDGWLTMGRWSFDSDFMIHGWKMENLVPPRLAYVMDKLNPDQMRLIRFAGWVPPFTQLFDQKSCKEGLAIWHFNADLIATEEEVKKSLERLEKKVNYDYWRSLSRIEDVFQTKYIRFTNKGIA